MTKRESLKAGLREDAWRSSDIELQSFEAEVFAEVSREGLR